LGAASQQGEGLGWGRGGEVEGRESEGPKLLLNQGPSEPCYATAATTTTTTTPPAYSILFSTGIYPRLKKMTPFEYSITQRNWDQY